MSMIKIHTADSEVEAALIKGYLGSCGIEATVGPGNNSLGLGYNISKGPNVDHDIFVEESDAEEAKKLIAERE